MAIPTLAAIFLEINALLIAIMIACLVAHEATAIWDVSYAHRSRTEQHVHSFLEMLPLLGLLIIAMLHWQQFLCLFGLSQQAAEYALRLKQPPWPWLYVSVILSLVVLFEDLPYVEELIRCVRRRKMRPTRDYPCPSNLSCSFKFRMALLRPAPIANPARTSLA
jgi:hypothetical protein